MIKIENKVIGEGNPCFIAAEVGINHNGDMDLAIRTIDAAIASGADAVKFQNYYTEDFVLDKTLSYTYISQGTSVTESQYDMFKRYELNLEQLEMLKRHCDKKGVVFFSTPTSERGLDDLKKIGVSLLKNGSDFLVNTSFIKKMAYTGIPTIISTGMAHVAEIDEAVRAFEEAGGKDLLLLHCTSSYPTPDDDIHLNKITSLRSAFGYPVGFSDHTWGAEAAIGSVVLGAVFIEKHFTLDNSLPGPDHRFSSDPKEFGNLVAAVRKIERALGSAKLGPTASEKLTLKDFRLSCAVNKDLEAGHTIREDDLIFLRPATGIHPSFANHIIGNKTRVALSKGDFIQLGSMNFDD